jgi:ElaB/YqjD/DUF883 family membrane-anchored ribosome-binding protein
VTKQSLLLRLSVAAWLLAMACLSPASVDASQPSRDSKVIWSQLKNDLSALLDSSLSLEAELRNLQTANNKLIQLSERQRRAYTELQQLQEQTATSLEQSGQALVDLKSYIPDLERSIRSTEAALVRSNRIWQIGIPAALALGILGGVLVAAR